AGQGTRMRSRRPKVLQTLAGKPLLAHVLDTADQLHADGIHVVYGHGGEQVPEAFPDRRVSWVRQESQLGTGHAVAQAMPKTPDDHLVMVLHGDVPLTRAETLQGLVDAATDNDLVLLTTKLDDPSGYGRVIRNKHGAVERVVEHKDASDSERR